MELDGFDTRDFTYDGKTKPVFWRGSGPGVVIIHEIPGITPPVREFAVRVADAGFTTVLPQLFGTPGRAMSGMYVLKSLAEVCVSREFSLLSTHQSSPVTDWLRALCRSVHSQCKGPGVGALGMCLTGGFAIALMVDPSVVAPVLSQPSLPFAIGKRRKASIGTSPTQFAAAKRRCMDDDLTVLGLRFTNDILCPAARFETLRKEFGDCFEAIEINSSPGNPHKIPRTAHSVLTVDLVDQEGHPTRAALDRVLAFFRERLAGQ